MGSVAQGRTMNTPLSIETRIRNGMVDFDVPTLQYLLDQNLSLPSFISDRTSHLSSDFEFEIDGESDIDDSDPEDMHIGIQNPTESHHEDGHPYPGRGHALNRQWSEHRPCVRCTPSNPDAYRSMMRQEYKQLPEMYKGMVQMLIDEGFRWTRAVAAARHRARYNAVQRAEEVQEEQARQRTRTRARFEERQRTLRETSQRQRVERAVDLATEQAREAEGEEPAPVEIPGPEQTPAGAEGTQTPQNGTEEQGFRPLSESSPAGSVAVAQQTTLVSTLDVVMLDSDP